MKRKKEKTIYDGSALAYGLVIMTIVMFILTSMLSYIVAQMKYSLNRVEKEKAFQVAESGVYYYRWYLAHKTSGKTAQQIEDFWKNGSPLGVGSTAVQDYNGIGQFSLTVTPPASGSTIVSVVSEGYSYKEPDIKRKIKVRFRRPSWSEYMFLSNGFMHFGTEAEVWGKVHSNYGIRFDGKAHNTVSALPAKFDDPDHGGCQEYGVHTHADGGDGCAPSGSYPWSPPPVIANHPSIFMGGREFPVPEISFTGVTTDLANMKTRAQSGDGKYFNSSGLGRRIILKNDGTYDVCTVNKINSSTRQIASNKGYLKTSGSGTCDTCSGQCLSNYSIVNDGVIFVEDNAWVEGTVNNKRISIVAADLSGGGVSDIYIGVNPTENLRLAAYDCDNMLGLVAQHDIRILGSCPDDFVIDAALLSQNGTVGINENGFGNKNILTINGAIVSYLQPYFQIDMGWFGTSGFDERRYNFNNNLLYCPPPYFPTGTEYSVDSWEEL